MKEKAAGTLPVKLLTCLVTDSIAHNAGDTVDWDATDAQRLFDAGYAEPAQEKGSGGKHAAAEHEAPAHPHEAHRRK